MVFVVLRIVSGVKILKNWFGCSVPDTASFLDVFAEFSLGNLDKGKLLPEEFSITIARVFVGKSNVAVGIDIQPNLLIRDVIPSLGIYVQFYVSTVCTDGDVFSTIINENDEMSCSVNSGNASTFAVFMTSATQRKHLLPFLPTTSANNKTKIKNDIMEFLQKNKVGWSALNANSMGVQFVNTLSACMWVLDGHHETLAERSCTIPSELKFLSGYNKPESHKHRKR